MRVPQPCAVSAARAGLVRPQCATNIATARFDMGLPLTGAPLMPEPVRQQQVSCQARSSNLVGNSHPGNKAATIARNVAYIGAIASALYTSWRMTGHWWMIPVGMAIPSMLWRLARSGGSTSKLQQLSVSVDPQYVATTDAAKKELHEFMCMECGYTIFPARGREDVFFSPKFSCPMCQAPREKFIDMKDDSDDVEAAAPSSTAT
mmetsp:Transcript_12312/g.28842  ORF Transcript_12312/g.28842 Transcript_12312/m.28842 type:complete len:205 (-) Transcript_12312:103-717(-)